MGFYFYKNFSALLVQCTILRFNNNRSVLRFFENINKIFYQKLDSLLICIDLQNSNSAKLAKITNQIVVTIVFNWLCALVQKYQI